MIVLYWRNAKVWGGSTVVLLVMEIGKMLMIYETALERKHSKSNAVDVISKTLE